ncbi:hypothetical protein KHA94_14900 [Bacillus sp. FJAT-49705]|uniref:MFS transporter n=1 Tax=Cytobacillus citreus TaxID=2833586 RepID=A0ABS5NUH0_9BACI|nr:hypothetical protein [Cytobacillus citreus]MBS4191476.1 hypothetical protein [Cytobacillus citreus]
MVVFIFSIASLLILIPIVAFLPIGISFKRKWVLVGMAFLIANVGLIVSTLFHLWNTVQILLLLILLASIILNSRYKRGTALQDSAFLIEKTSNSQDDENLHNVQMEASPLNQINIQADEIIQSPADNYSEEEGVLLNLEDKTEESDTAQFTSLEKIAINPNLSNEFADSFAIDEDISFLNNRSNLLNNDNLVEEKHEKEGNDFEIGYMSEIEKLMKKNDLNYIDNIEIDSHCNKIEMEELSEIEVSLVYQESEIDEKENVFSDEIEIEELVFVQK